MCVLTSPKNLSLYEAKLRRRERPKVQNQQYSRKLVITSDSSNHNSVVCPHSPGSSFRLSPFLPRKEGRICGGRKEKLAFPPHHHPADRTALQSHTEESTMSQALHTYNSSTRGDHNQSSSKTSLDYIRGYENSGC